MSGASTVRRHLEVIRDEAAHASRQAITQPWVERTIAYLAHRAEQALAQLDREASVARIVGAVERHDARSRR